MRKQEDLNEKEKDEGQKNKDLEVNNSRQEVEESQLETSQITACGLVESQLKEEGEWQDY